MKQLLVTGSSGLIGSEVCLHFSERGWQVIGLNNNQRAVFFGPQGDTRWNQRRLQEQLGNSWGTAISTLSWTFAIARGCWR